MLWQRMRIAAGLAVLVCLTGLLGGCGGGAVGSLLKVTAAAAVLDGGWPSGSTVIGILADVSGYTMVRKAYATVRRIGASETRQIELVPGPSGKLEGALEVDAAAEPAEYSVVVTATDSSGATASSEPVSVEVPPAETQPAPE